MTDDPLHREPLRPVVSLGDFASGPNLFPQAGNFNQSAFARLENPWRQTLDEGLTVVVDIALTIGEERNTPPFVLVTYWEDGAEWEHSFLNEGHVL